MTRLIVISIFLLIAPLTLLTGSNAAYAEPAIVVSPQEGPGGTTVRVDGFGFVPSSVVTITLNGGKMETRPFAITANDLGEFDATFAVPHSIQEGTYPVVANGHGLVRVSASSTFEVTVPNTPPVADSQSVSVDQSKEVNIKLKGSDPEGDEITFSIVDEPQHGTVDEFDKSTGSLTFVPSRDYEGNDRFTFKVNDGKLDSFLADVSIKILKSDGAPRMENMEVEMQEDMQLTILLQATNEDSSPLRFEIVDLPQHGSLGFIKPYDSNSASITYAPNLNFNGTDTFTAKASDTRSESETATVTILVTPVQDSPIAIGAQTTTAQEKSIEITLTASDPDGDVLAYTVQSLPGHGTLMGSAPNLKYIPSFDFRGWDSFTFKVNDGTVDSSTARIEIEVTKTSSSEAGNDGSGNSDSDSTQGSVEPSQEIPDPGVTETPVPPATGEVTPPAAEPIVSSPADGESAQPQIESGDTVPPRIIFPASTQIFDSQSEAGASAVYNIIAIDAIDGEVTPECTPASGSTFPIGKVNVVCTATDAAGNTALGSFAVEVRQIAGANKETSPFPFDSFEFQIPDMQFAVLPVIIAAVAGIGLAIGLKVAKKTKAKSSQPQKSSS
ncbi:MAG TPA: Ig-like domain-containing protein [Nitrososphaera sp.]|nr:Ig-like domain-containing protein [Nitrososphaera sp.]